MSKQRYINTKFWDDTYIINLDPIEKLLFLYFLTTPLTNVSGIYEISLKRIAFDTGIDSEMIEKILKRFEKDNKMIYRDGWLCIINFIKNQSLNPSVIEGIKRELESVPKSKLKEFTTACDSLRQEGTLNLTKPNLTKGNKTNSFFKDLLDIFINLVKEKSNFKYKPTPKDCVILKNSLKQLTPKEIEKIFKWYFTTEKSQTHLSISASLSKATLNLFNEKEAKSKWNEI